MATLITLFVLATFAGLVLCRFAGAARARAETIVATTEHQIDDFDFVIEYRHNVTAGIFRVFAIKHPQIPFNTDAEECGITANGQVLTTVQPRSLEHAEAIAHAWMEKYANFLRNCGAQNIISRPARPKKSKSVRASSF